MAVYGPQRRPVVSGRFGPRYGKSTAALTFEPNVSDMVLLARKGRAWEKGAQKALVEAHTEMAATVAQYAAEELRAAKRRSGRAQRPDSLLLESITHGRNRSVNASGFKVGLADWLFGQSPAKKYARRIEQGGPNPMAAVGPITGFFMYPGGPSAPTSGRRSQGRLIWNSARGKDTFVIRANDIVSSAGGYRMHAKAGQRFLNSRTILPIYRKHFAKHGLNIDLMAKSKGITIRNR